MPEIATAITSRLFYRKMGTGPVVVLLHGFPEDGTLWKHIWDQLAASFTVIIPDFPGSGDSALENNTTIAQLAECVNAILEHENIDKAVIVGHSMGGYVALAFAAQYPDKVVGLSLVHSTPVADDEEKKIARKKSIDIIQKGGKTTFISQMVPNLFSAAYKNTHAAAMKAHVEHALDMGERSLVNFYNAMISREGHENMLKNINFPLQWVVGLEDNVIPYKKILPHLYQSRINFVSFYPECGHMSMVEAPQALASDLEKFITYSYNYQHVLV
jgi:pimeloyl-ACP methyl ester carboxylesterase